MKNNLQNAIYTQKNALIKETPMLNKLDFICIYEPLSEVSGDFYDFYKVNDDLVIGILFDVMGNGVSAALSVFAYKVLFKEASFKYKDPIEIITYMNKKSIEYLKEIYTSSICFTFDFKRGLARIVSAGINKFIYLGKQDESKEVTIKGPPLGMIDLKIFEEKTIEFKSKDMFVFFTDGIESMFPINSIFNHIYKMNHLENIYIFLNNFIKHVEIKDDCTVIAFQIK